MSATRVLIALALFAAYTVATAIEQPPYQVQTYSYPANSYRYAPAVQSEYSREKRFHPVLALGALGLGAAGVFGAGLAVGGIAHHALAYHHPYSYGGYGGYGGGYGYHAYHGWY